MVRPREGIEHRFIREYEITNFLHTVKGVINVFDIGEDDRGMFYTMELCEQNLSNLMNEVHATLTEEERIEYIISIVSTMAEVHDMDILHRDLCPSNILLRKGLLYISDFGLGKSLSEEHSRHTTNTTEFGHYGYTAPEQFNNLKDASKQSDVFSLGKIINFIMTNHHDNTDHSLSTVCVAATAQNELIRYSDAKELLEVIQSTNSKIKDTKFADACLSIINNNQCNSDVGVYLSNMDAITTHSNFKIPYYRNVIIKFLKTEPSHNINFLTKLRKAMRNCQNFESYDDYSFIFYELLSDKELDISIDALYIAAKALKYIAYKMNRFDAQRKIENLKSQVHVHPQLIQVMSK